MRACALAMAVALMLAAGAPAWALTNGSFESGLTGWTTVSNGGSISAVTEHDAVGLVDVILDKEYQPTDGDQFALLRAGDKNKWVTLSQTFSVDCKSDLSFNYFFDSAEGDIRVCLGYDDQASGTLDGNSLFLVTSSDLFPFDSGSTCWQDKTVCLDPGQYTLVFEIMNVKDGLCDSYLGIDDVSVECKENGGAVPEPMTMLAVFSSIGGLTGYIRRRRRD